MPETTKPSETPPRPTPSHVEAESDKKLDRIADDAAKRAGKTEQRYDDKHDIFTK